MQDRFRFRFWDKEAQTMQKFPKVELNYRTTLDEIFDDSRVIFMQCTGLIDKNNKLIYEGDILRQPDGIIDYVWWADGCYIHNGTAITNYDAAYQGDIWAKEVNTHEVIGNIYENPELLEVQMMDEQLMKLLKIKEQECERLRQRIVDYKCPMHKNAGYCGYLEEGGELNIKLIRLEQTLAEIKEIAGVDFNHTCWKTYAKQLEQIIQKIDEVLND